MNSDQLSSLVSAATRAPSGHNTQPWHFTAKGNEIVISPNYSRELPAVDSNRRELFISLGCAAENLCLQASVWVMLPKPSSMGTISVSACKRPSILLPTRLLPISTNAKPTVRCITVVQFPKAACKLFHSNRLPAASKSTCSTAKVRLSICLLKP